LLYFVKIFFTKSNWQTGGTRRCSFKCFSCLTTARTVSIGSLDNKQLSWSAWQQLYIYRIPFNRAYDPASVSHFLPKARSMKRRNGHSTHSK
jgi:hypothetical protein